MKEEHNIKMSGKVVSKILESSIHKIAVNAIDMRTDEYVDLTLFLNVSPDEDVRADYIISVLHQLGYRFNGYIGVEDIVTISQNCEELFENGKAKES